MYPRTLFLVADIDDYTANKLVAALLHLNAVDPDLPISLVIDSRGGSITGGLMIYDTIRYITAPVSTVCLSVAESMAAFILAAGRKGERLAMPHSRIVIEQPFGETERRQASDLLLEMNEMSFTRRKINECMAEMTGQTIQKIAQDTDRRYYLSASDAVKYGLIDHVITTPPRDLVPDPNYNPLIEPGSFEFAFL
uniref:ATP-dependent Clp protease proteolytic subunit n=1 Tax=Paulinella micropora TaxID=1928728 RepID=A0A385HZH9_9EUKA|nr:ATP-dependent Clp protease proteolytic subunit [Paulinella micropora]AXY63061.1 ATP-dependent Clp protease proteolytic subunit [Paulinella micropora]